MPAFSALASRNFRLFLGGQFVSLCGTWMQSVAHGWLVLDLSGSPLVVGVVSALGSLPILLLTLYGGVLADRVDRRRALLLLQSLMLAEALLLATLTATGRISVPWVMALAVFFGTLTAFEVPIRQSLVADLVPRRDLMSAIAMNSSAFNVARVVGPAVAGLVIASLGVAACFFANAVSYVAVLAGLLAMRLEPHVRPATPIDVLASLGEAWRFVTRERWPRALMLLTVALTVFSYAFLTMLPVFARQELAAGAQGYGTVVAATGIGAAAGALFLAGLGTRIGLGRLAMAAAGLFGIALAATAGARSVAAAASTLAVVGLLQSLHGIAANTLLQRQAPDTLRGRVIGFYSFVVLGLAPLGALQAGWVSEHLGVRYTFLIGGIVALLATAGIGWHLLAEAGSFRTGLTRDFPAAAPAPTPAAPDGGPTA